MEEGESQDEKEDELLRKMKKEQCASDEDPICRVLKVLYMYCRPFVLCPTSHTS